MAVRVGFVLEERMLQPAWRAMRRLLIAIVILVPALLGATGNKEQSGGRHRRCGGKAVRRRRWNAFGGTRVCQCRYVLCQTRPHILPCYRSTRTGAAGKALGVLMFSERNIIPFSCVLFCAVCILVQPSYAQTPEVSYALKPGKAEVSIQTGFYVIEHGEHYRPGGRALLAGGVAVGLSPHVAVEFGVSRAAYRNDLYWKPDPPNNPYLATGVVMSLFGGGRYEFRRPDGRVRPYLGAGMAATRFTDVERGPKTLCSDDGSCFVMAPELFDGTKLTPFFDMGINFMVQPTWGIRVGFKPYLYRGDETNPVRSITGPSGSNRFWHTQFYVGALYRWR